MKGGGAGPAVHRLPLKRHYITKKQKRVIVFVSF
jgi:hypothetical protein